MCLMLMREKSNYLLGVGGKVNVYRQIKEYVKVYMDTHSIRTKLNIYRKYKARVHCLLSLPLIFLQD